MLLRWNPGALPVSRLEALRALINPPPRPPLWLRLWRLL
jgi:hypothetical protein